MMELGWDDPITLRKGFCGILDVKDMGFRLMQWATPKNLIFAVKKLEAMPVKDLKIHCVNKSRYLSTMMTITWPFLPAKFKENVMYIYDLVTVVLLCFFLFFFRFISMRINGNHFISTSTRRRYQRNMAAQTRSPTMNTSRTYWTKITSWSKLQNILSSLLKMPSDTGSKLIRLIICIEFQYCLK